MWTRAELKEKAKIAFKCNYWSCVLVAFVLGLLVSGNSSSANLTIDTDLLNNMFHNNIYYEESLAVDGIGISGITSGVGFFALSILGVIVVLAVAIGLALRIFVFTPIEVGGCRFFVENSFDRASASQLFYGFTNGHYKNVIYTMFFRDLYTFLWTLLFVIPGIVKSYEYRMVPYLLADCPDMPKEDAFAISKELMMGNKWDAFVLDLSFIGWNILNAFTCGILAIFWTNPYIQATDAELFLALKTNYFSGRQVSQEMNFENNDFNCR